MSAAKRARGGVKSGLELLPPHLLSRVLCAIADDSRAVGGVILANKSLLATAGRSRGLWKELWPRHALDLDRLSPRVRGCVASRLGLTRRPSEIGRNVVRSDAPEVLMSMKVPRRYWRWVEDRVLSVPKRPLMTAWGVRCSGRGVMTSRSSLYTLTLDGHVCWVDLEDGVTGLVDVGMGRHGVCVGLVDAGGLVAKYNLGVNGTGLMARDGRDWVTYHLPELFGGLMAWLADVGLFVGVSRERVVVTGPAMEVTNCGQLESPDSAVVERVGCVGTAWGGRWFLCGYRRVRPGGMEDILAVARACDLEAGRFAPTRLVGNDGEVVDVCEVSGGASATVATVGSYGYVSVWSLGGGGCCLRRLSLGVPVLGVCSPTPYMLLVVSSDGGVRVVRSKKWGVDADVTICGALKDIRYCWCKQGQVVLCGQWHDGGQAWYAWG